MSYRAGLVLIALVFGVLPQTAVATCQVSIIGNLTLSDKTLATTVADPVPLVAGHAVDGIVDGSVAPPPGGYLLNGEGSAERVADLLIYDATGQAGPGFCFNARNTISLRVNAVVSSPSSASLMSTANLNAYDSNGPLGLTLGSASVSQIYSVAGTQSQITISVVNAGTASAVAGPNTVLYGHASGATGSAVRIKNVRIDATTVSGNSPTNVTINASQNGVAVPVILGMLGGPAQSAVGIKLVSVSNTEQPAIPVAGGIGSGVQGSGEGLQGGPQGFSFTPAFAGAFRLRGDSCQTASNAPAGGCVSQVANDVATAATSLVFALTDIPSGVTVSFPPRIDTTAANGAAGGMIWAARSGTLTNGGRPGSLAVVYDTVVSGTSPGVQAIETADHADSGTAVASSLNPNCTPAGAGVACDANPKIGVIVGSPSGSGTARLTVAIGPADASQFSADDVAANGVMPRYSGSSAPTGGIWPSGGSSNTVFTRYIVDARDFLTVFPTRTTLLFPFVSTMGGFNTGLSIVNTCRDTVGTAGNSVYGTYANSSCNQTGGVTFFFFGFDPSMDATIQASLLTDRTRGGVDVNGACRGFDALGRLAPGRVANCTTSMLLSLLPGVPRSFDGYVIAVAEFNNGHGFSVQFNAAGTPFAGSAALIMADAARPSGGESLGH